MKLELEVKTKEDAKKLIEQLQGFIEENNENLYPNISGFDNYYHIDNWRIVKKTSGKTGSTEYLANIYKTEKIAKKALEFKKSRRVWNFIEKLGYAQLYI